LPDTLASKILIIKLKIQKFFYEVNHHKHHELRICELIKLYLRGVFFFFVGDCSYGIKKIITKL